MLFTSDWEQIVGHVGKNGRHWSSLAVNNICIPERMLPNRSLQLGRVNVFRRAGIDVGGSCLSVSFQVIHLLSDHPASLPRVLRRVRRCQNGFQTGSWLV